MDNTRIVDSFLKFVQHNDLRGIKQFLEKNRIEISSSKFVNVNSLCHKSSGDSALHVAARLGHLELLKYLIEGENGNIELANRDGKTALHDAAQFTQFEIVEYLLERGANVNAVKKADWTPLMLACTKENPEIVRILLHAGADTLFKNKDGWNSLHIAVREGNLEIVSMILQHSARNPAEKAQLCQTKSKNGRSLLHTSVMHGHVEVTNLLLSQESALFDVNDGDQCGTTPLMDASRFGFANLLELLIDKFGADLTAVNKLSMNCLHIASEAGQTEIIDLLITKYGIEVNGPSSPTGLTPLHWAVKEDHVDAVKRLIQLGGRCDILDFKGWTCLEMGKRLKKTRVSEYLDSINLKKLDYHIDNE